MNPLAIRIDERDNVGVALEEISAGAKVKLRGLRRSSVVALQAVPFAHKIALDEIPAGSAILKYGVPVAFATTKIAKGEWVHEHNAASYFAAKRGREQS